MRERITFVHSQGVEFDPESLTVKPTELLGPSIKASREDRLSIGIEELPLELTSLLSNYRTLSIRWASPSAYDTEEPLASRLPPGLHVSFTPLKAGKDDRLRLCATLQALGPLDCMSAEAFTTLSEGQEVNTPATTFYQELEDLSTFIPWAAREICSETDVVCQTRIEGLPRAVSLDVSWDSVLQTLRVSSLFPLSTQRISVPASSKRRTEVGILSQDAAPNQQPHEIGLSGILTVLGEKEKPSGTLFAFPSRHRNAKTSFSVQFLNPSGLHPTLQLKVSSNMPPVAESECALHAYFTLPKTIFADRYQLADELLLASKNLTASRYTSLPVDLEAPAYTTKTWGSNILLQLAPPSSDKPEAWTAEVPLHLRYLIPSASGKVDIEIPYPALFWACESTAAVDFSNNPFDRTTLGYDGLFNGNTVFWHAKPQPLIGDRIMTPISVPVLKGSAASWVGLGTAATVALGFAWVLWKLAAVFAVSGYESKRVNGPSGNKKDK